MSWPPVPRVSDKPASDQANDALHRCIVILYEAVDRERGALAPLQRKARGEPHLYAEVARRVSRIDQLEFCVRVLRDKLVVEATPL